MWLHALGGLIVSIIIVLMGVGIYISMTQNHSRASTSSQITALVDSVNKVNHYTYTFEKHQDENLRNLDSNVYIVKKRIDEVANAVDELSSTTASKTELQELQQNRNNFDTVKISDFEIGPTTESSESIGITHSSKPVTVRTDNIVLQGGLTTGQPVKCTSRSGSMIENRNDNTNERYGIGRYDQGTMRIYSANKVALSQAQSNGGFIDIMEANPNAIIANKPLCIGSQCFVPSSDGLLLCPYSNPSPANPQCKNINKLWE